MAESLLARTNLNLLWIVCLTSYVYLPLNSRGTFVLWQVVLVAPMYRGVCVCIYVHVCIWAGVFDFVFVVLALYLGVCTYTCSLCILACDYLSSLCICVCVLCSLCIRRAEENVESAPTATLYHSLA